MKRHNLSQVPILIGSTILGSFSHRSFSEGILKLAKREKDVVNQPVEAFSEELKITSIHEELTKLLEEFELKDAVLVGSENRLQGVVTTVDVLQYLYKAASAYIMLGEIELAIRELMNASVNGEELQHCIDKCLKENYEKHSYPIPTRLEDMNLGDYVLILRYKGFWGKFKDTFGGSYSMAQVKLELLSGLRNDVFHFRRDLTDEEYGYLKDTRDWLLKRIVKLESTK